MVISIKLLEKPFFDITGRMFIIGLMLGPFNHFWYKMLDKYIIGTGIKMVTKKIAADQAVAGPFFCTTFLIGNLISNLWQTEHIFMRETVLQSNT